MKKTILVLLMSILLLSFTSAYFNDFNNAVVCQDWVGDPSPPDCTTKNLQGSGTFYLYNFSFENYTTDSVYLQYDLNFLEPLEQLTFTFSNEIDNSFVIFDPNTNNINIDNAIFCSYNIPDIKRVKMIYAQGNITLFINNTYVCDVYDPLWNLTFNKLEFDMSNNQQIVDNFYVDYSEPPCIPDWQCNGYGLCLSNSTQNCNSVEDLYTCGNSYDGDYSEFTPQACSYVPPITGYVPAHTSSDIPAVVIDFGVEFGLMMISLVAIIVIGAGGVYLYKMVNKK